MEGREGKTAGKGEGEIGQQIETAPTSLFCGQSSAALWAVIIRYENVGLIRPEREGNPVSLLAHYPLLKDLTTNTAIALMPLDKVLLFLPIALIILFKAT